MAKKRRKGNREIRKPKKEKLPKDQHASPSELIDKNRKANDAQRR